MNPELPAKHILVVEDDRDIRDALVDLLSEEGYLVSTAENGQEALDFLHETVDLPSLILLDLMMPVKDGREFRLEQKSDLRLHKIPVILMSADGRIEGRKADYAVEHHIRKPADVSTILEMVQRLS